MRNALEEFAEYSADNGDAYSDNDPKRPAWLSDILGSKGSLSSGNYKPEEGGWVEYINVRRSGIIAADTNSGEEESSREAGEYRARELHTVQAAQDLKADRSFVEMLGFGDKDFEKSTESRKHDKKATKEADAKTIEFVEKLEKTELARAPKTEAERLAETIRQIREHKEKTELGRLSPDKTPYVDMSQQRGRSQENIRERSITS